MQKILPLPNGTTVYVSASIDPRSMLVPDPTDTTWVEVKKVTGSGLSPSGGEEKWSSYQPLSGYEDKRFPTGRSLHDMALEFQDDPDSIHATLITDARDVRRLLAWQIKLPSGALITFPAYATGGYIPTLNRNELMVVTFTLGLTAMPKRRRPA
ncbi:phage tail tube protein [Pseudomonas benzopyrenica]|uniref:Phage tail tube protein n=1 Tax=Pseudomonas benzopyrenica TaxID=2993566 RepID=A0ABZ2FZ72_9PSED